MDHDSIDDKIAEEQHKALSYSSYSNGTTPKQSEPASGSPFIRFSYLPKRTILLASIAGLILLAGGVSAYFSLSKSDANTANTDESSKTTTDEPGTIVGYDGEIQGGSTDGNASQQKTSEDKSTQPASDVVTSTFQALGLVKSTGNTSKSSSSSTSTKTTKKSPSPAPAPKATKLLVFIVENRSYSTMKTSMPYLYSQALRYGYGTSYYATNRPSLPNYLAIATGSSHGVTNNKDPSANEFVGSSVFNRAIKAGKTAALYSESLPSPCKLTNSSNGNYVVRHNPWAYVKNQRDTCKANNGAMSKFSYDVSNGKLPTVGMVVPNICNSGHDCSIATTDAWLKNRLQKVYANADWKSGRLAVVVLPDEASKGDASNRVFFVLIHPSQKNNVKSCKLSHYSLSRLYSDISKTAPIGNASGAASISACFGMTI